MSEENAIRIAASLEQISNHPVAKAVTQAAATKGLALLTPADLRSVAGFGVEGSIDGGFYRFGGSSFSTRPIGKHSQKISSYLIHNGKMVARFHFEDELRPEAETTLDRLRGQGFNRIGILSGDRQEIVDALGGKLRLDFGYGQLLPEQKYERPRTRRQCGNGR